MSPYGGSRKFTGRYALAEFLNQESNLDSAAVSREIVAATEQMASPITAEWRDENVSSQSLQDPIYHFVGGIQWSRQTFQRGSYRGHFLLISAIMPVSGTAPLYRI